MFTEELSAALDYVRSVDRAEEEGASPEELEALWGDYIGKLYRAMEATIEVPPFVAPWRGVLPQACQDCGHKLVGVGWGNWTLRHEPYLHLERWTCPACMVAAAEERLAAEEA